MKKRLWKLLAVSLTAAMLAAGCGGKVQQADKNITGENAQEELSGGPEGEKPEGLAGGSEEEKQEVSKADDGGSDAGWEPGGGLLSGDGGEAAGMQQRAAEAFAGFLQNGVKVMTADSFGEDDKDGNFMDELLYGEYSLEDLKYNFFGMYEAGCSVKYFQKDLTGDGVEELVVCLEAENDTLLNWTGVIRFDGDGLVLSHAYQDGYRTLSRFYENGYLEKEGSMGAGAYYKGLVEFNGKAEGITILEENEYYGTCCCWISYDLADKNDIEDKYSGIIGESRVFVRTHKTRDGMILTAKDFSEDAKIKKQEENMLKELESLGAVLVSEAEFEALENIEDYADGEVDWKFLDEEAADAGSVESVQVVYLEDAGGLAGREFYEYAMDESEYRSKLLVTPLVPSLKRFKVLSIMAEDLSEDGVLMCSWQEEYSLDELTDRKPLVLAMTFWGDLPTAAISFEDEERNAHAYAISQSGRDGSIVLEGILLK